MSRDASLLRSCLFMSLAFTCYEVEVTWLNEMAEALKNVCSAINAVLLAAQNALG